MNNFLNRQDGVAMLMVIAFMALSIPMLTGSLVFASTLGRDSVVKTEILKRQYAALGGDQWGNYLNGEEEPPGCYTVVLNGETISVCIADVPPLLSQPPPADNSRRLFSSITVTPTIAFPAPPAPPDPVPQPFTFTITVTNRDDEPEKLTKIHAVLPPGFTYVEDSTTLENPGPTAFNDPSISGQKLTWNMSPLKLILQPAAPGVPAEYGQLSFVAEAILYEGNYCTEAWADPGQVKTGTGWDALIQVGDPDNNLCTGAALSLDNTVYVHPGEVVRSNPFGSTYTLYVENRGTLPLNVSQVRDLLSPGFLYVPGTSDGDLLNDAEPNATMFQGRQRLDWNFDPKLVIPSGDKWEGTFTVQGPFAGGHWNDAWLTLDEFGDTQYTWPSAGIEVIEADESTTVIGDYSIYSLIWKIGPDTTVLWEWAFSS